MNFRDQLTARGKDGWTEIEPAIVALGAAIGLPLDDLPRLTSRSFLNTNNPLLAALYETLCRLVENGVLEERDGPSDIEYRWTNFDIDFEAKFDSLRKTQPRPPSDPTT